MTALFGAIAERRALKGVHMASAGVSYQGTREMTIDELLLENRVVFLIGEINQSSAARLIMQMFYLENLKKGQEIHFYINLPAALWTTRSPSTTPCGS